MANEKFCQRDSSVPQSLPKGFPQFSQKYRPVYLAQPPIDVGASRLRRYEAVSREKHQVGAHKTLFWGTFRVNTFFHPSCGWEVHSLAFTTRCVCIMPFTIVFRLWKTCHIAWKGINRFPLQFLVFCEFCPWILSVFLISSTFNTDMIYNAWICYAYDATCMTNA